MGKIKIVTNVISQFYAKLIHGEKSIDYRLLCINSRQGSSIKYYLSLRTQTKFMVNTLKGSGVSQ